MILYNVTVSVESSIHQQWLTWMQEVHIPEVMATGKFKTYRVCKLLQPVPEEGVTFAVQYYCDSRAVLDQYFADHAPALQAAHQARFGGQAMAFRTILEVL